MRLHPSLLGAVGSGRFRFGGFLPSPSSQLTLSLMWHVARLRPVSEMSVSLLTLLTWPVLLKSLKSPIACSDASQVAIMFPMQGNWLDQLLMDYPQEKNVEGREVKTTSLGFVVWGFSVQWLLSRQGVTWGRTD